MGVSKTFLQNPSENGGRVVNPESANFLATEESINPLRTDSVKKFLLCDLIPVAAFPHPYFSHLTVTLTASCHCNLKYRKVALRDYNNYKTPGRHSMLSRFSCKTNQTCNKATMWTLFGLRFKYLSMGIPPFLAKMDPTSRRGSLTPYNMFYWGLCFDRTVNHVCLLFLHPGDLE